MADIPNSPKPDKALAELRGAIKTAINYLSSAESAASDALSSLDEAGYAASAADADDAEAELQSVAGPITDASEALAQAISDLERISGDLDEDADNEDADNEDDERVVEGGVRAALERLTSGNK
jgi:hypothetical protein